ncbi:MAG: Smr/MutS family protein, partial [Bacteroidota bacterium]|nr:Smr/MutS family protein [Bacteroidota bacterium]
VHQSPELLGVTLINNTEADVLFTYGEETAARPYRALAADKLGPKTSTKPLSFLHLKDFEAWPAVVFQLLPTRHNGEAAYELLTKRQAFKASTFYGSQKPAPVIGKDAYLFQLDEKAAAAIEPEKLAAEAPAAAAAAAPAQPAGVDAVALKAQLSGDAPAKPAAVVAAAAPKPAAPVMAPPHEFDLHLEALRPDDKDEELSNTAILRIQLDAFEDALIRALATNMHEIVFIHGLGSGTLRKEIHRQLSRNKDIKFFEDAQKGKFGFGATLVRLK